MKNCLTFKKFFDFIWYRVIILSESTFIVYAKHVIMLVLNLTLQVHWITIFI